MDEIINSYSSVVDYKTIKECIYYLKKQNRIVEINEENNIKYKVNNEH
jgi:hypothetical protein